MSFIFRSFFSLLRYAIGGYILLLSFLVFNKYINFSLTHQFNDNKNMNFIETIIFITKNRLTHNDFIFCLYGLVFMLFVGLLRNFEKRTRTY